MIRNNNAKVEPRSNAYPLGINFGGIYSSGVTLFRHGPTQGFEFRMEPFRCGVISVAALNFRENTRYAVVFAILSNPADAKEKFAPFYCLFG